MADFGEDADRLRLPSCRITAFDGPSSAYSHQPATLARARHKLFRTVKIHQLLVVVDMRFIIFVVRVNVCVRAVILDL